MLTQEQIDKIVTQSKEANEDSIALARRIEMIVRQDIAEAWDGCIAEADAHGEVDVGASIRAGHLVDA